MEQHTQPNVPNNDDISLFELVQQFKKYWNYLLSKWLIIVIVGFSGAAIGLITSLLIKPKYTAHLSFALIEKTSSGGLASLASSFGLGSMIGSGGSGAFSGDNLLEIIQSRHAIEQTLLTPVDFNGQQKTLMEAYMDYSEMRKSLKKKKNNKALLNLAYPIGQDRKSFNRTQDSVLFVVYNGFIKSQSLVVERKDKKVSIVNMKFTSRNELFSKLFVETLMQQTYEFYKQTKTAQSRYNVEIMEAKADSVRALYEAALYKGASIAQANINPALQIAAVPRIKQESNAQLFGAVYAEVLKNLEAVKLDMARETPIVQIVDTPRFPLEKVRIGKLKALVIGGLLGGFLIVFYLLAALFLKNVLNNEINNGI